MAAATLDHFHRYLPISPMDRAWGLYVICGGYLRVPKGAPYPPTGHPDRYALMWQSGRVLDEFQLHFITRGRGLFESGNDRPRQILPGMVFLLYPGVWHRYQPDADTGWDEFWMGFQGEHARRLMASPFFSHRHPVVAVDEKSALLEQFTGLIATMRADRAHMQRILAGYAQMMLGILQARIATGAMDATGSRIIERAKHAITQAMARPIDGQVMARQLGVGYHWLRRAFRQQTGFSLHDYHLQLRIHAAMQLLESAESEVGDIGRSVGFEDAFYFSRTFKRVTGMSPKRWRLLRRGQSP